MELVMRDNFLKTYKRSGADVNQMIKDAKQGNVEIMYQLGLCYYHGMYGFQKNNYNASQWFIKAADAGHMMAQYYAGYCFEKAIGVQRNAYSCAKYYKLAADQGLMNAQYEIGYLYEYGIGVEKDETQAAQYFEKATDQGHGAAACTLGYYYENGMGVE
ncbi:tetratricopeptide repeat protein [Absiella sp. AM29-15]|uniref:tetratricopeptide repeat protein n=1 Tax=Absiella sp. AM29-15 TaxID=2292278 RepID=UPI001314B985|nr:tetratricopeptide repeat protein [Absiella sp. AM29-15]